MQEDKYRQLHVDFELTNNINTARKMMIGLPGDRILILHQVISLLEYKYLSENAKNSKDDLGYELNGSLYYENLLINKGNVIDTLKKGIAQITQDNDNIQAANVFYDLFDLVNFEIFNKNDTWLVLINIVEKLCSETKATLGEIIIFLTKYASYKFITRGGNKPTEEIIKLITKNQKDVKNLYDPFTDEATLLAEIGNVINVENYYGQHPNKQNCTLAKMTLLANDVNYKNIFIKCNDIPEAINWKVKFDLCVSIPPFNRKIKLNEYEDARFKPYSPKRSEFAYILDMFNNLDDDGAIKIIVPNGVLFSSQDKNIIKQFVDNELISSIIGLPGGLFDTTGIQTTLLIINKKPTNEGIYYLNMRNAKIEKRLKRKISVQDIDKYTRLLSNKEEQELISTIATIEDIQENDYNLSINRYVDSEKLEEIDIEQTIANIKAIKKELKQVDEELSTKLGGLLN
ncbi:N-6 DNA methylase [Methanobrevibacter smithii]|uniref:N-6 DNA methylase n=1 Tax=Methanobrevibacter smithii TaxID=2173 RepID=UPI00037EC734|nr:class I SAM-dependent DNA methyltransferase [Methanobrevibacter smithii]